jgi:iron complex transport system ATP-binding protein
MLSACNLNLKHGSRPILSNLSLDVVPGELLVMLGPNGCGKSTLLNRLGAAPAVERRRLAPIWRSTSRSISQSIQQPGSVTLGGIDLRNFSARDLALRRAVLPQIVQRGFPFSAHERVLLGRFPNLRHRMPGRLDHRIAGLALERANADGLAARDVTTLSGGEFARVEFARALAQIWPASRASNEVQSSRYLLLDEPTAALDLKHQHHLLATAVELSREWGIGVLAIVHDLNLAARHADRIALLRDGAMIACAKPAEIMQPKLIERCFGMAVHSVMHLGRPFIVPL